MSVRLGIRRFHQRDKALEQVMAVLRPGARFGVVLDREHRLAAHAQALVACCRTARRWVGSTPPGRLSGSTTKPWFWLVISTLPVARSLTGWLAPRWPRAILAVRPPSASASNLVAEADAEDRLAGGDQFPQHRHRIFAGRRRIAGAVRQKDAVGPVAQHVLGRWRSPAPRSPGSHARRACAGCCAWRRNRPRRRDGAARAAGHSRVSRRHAVSSHS